MSIALNVEPRYRACALAGDERVEACTTSARSASRSVRGEVGPPRRDRASDFGRSCGRASADATRGGAASRRRRGRPSRSSSVFSHREEAPRLDPGR
jgi:hypothetical protein